MKPHPLLSELWKTASFVPNANQQQAILACSGPLHLPAGPGAGKTRVLLWRTVNLILVHGVPSEQIFLATFTEKAARQLRDGLLGLLGLATAHTGQPHDVSRMYVGTVHSLCQQLLRDRRFVPDGRRAAVPLLLDGLAQYFHLHKRARWNELSALTELEGRELLEWLKALFKSRSMSRHQSVSDCLSVFNRFSEELVDPRAALRRCQDADLARLLRFYAAYRDSLDEQALPRTDFALLQRHALDALNRLPNAGHVFRHVIVDEYQDTNHVQEQLFFRLAAGHRNLCVVGDDDQALYRFRGATVENFVAFPERCARALGRKPKQIPLDTNYRSRQEIVAFSGGFLDACDWSRRDSSGRRIGSWRVESKRIRPHRRDDGTAVVTTNADGYEGACGEVAALVRALVDAMRVTDISQIAFLYPSLKSKPAGVMMHTLEQAGFKVHAPRARPFLFGDEAMAVFGLLARIWGRPEKNAQYSGLNYDGFFKWLEGAERFADELIAGDKALARFIRDRASEPARSGLDLFYRLCGFRHFRDLLDLAESGQDEGPACNLAHVSRHLARFEEDFKTAGQFWLAVIYPLFCRGETEAEDGEHPFPRGRIPFLTIHQAKGLEFPVVVLGSPRRQEREPTLEKLVAPLLRRRGEPLERMDEFDRMRQFYVALTRAQDLLVIPHFCGRGVRSSAPFGDLLGRLPRTTELDLATMPAASAPKDDLPRTYSYSGDYTFYQTCPRQYLLFRRLEFAPARVQTRFFGQLVHQTIEDLHQRLIANRRTGPDA